MTEEAAKRAQIASDFLQMHSKHRKRIRSQSIKSNKNLFTAHQLALAAVVSYQNRIQGKQYRAEEAQVKGRMALVAQFMQGIDITETAISEGLYAQAANLLKQELETLASMEEFSMSARKDGQVPRFRGRLSDFGRRYGEFNEIAHPTRQEVVEQLSTFSDGDRYGPTTVPQFNGELFQMLYGNQALFISMMFAQMRPLFVEVFGVECDDAEVRLATNAIRILIDEGIINEIPAKN